MGNNGPGYATHPGHRVEVRPAGARVRVIFNGEVVADTLAALRLDESGYAPVYYVPRSDALMERFARTDHRSYCPFKGHASYFSLSAGDRVEPNAVWSYEQPFDEVAVIREHLAFYPAKVDRIETLPAR
jgi:uncharacterized protein (DUF427 family)